MAGSMKNRDINLIAALDRRRRIAKEERIVAVRLPILVLVLALLLLGAARYYIVTDAARLGELKEASVLYLNDPSTIADYEDSLRLQKEATGMVAQKDELGQALLNLSSYPDLTGSDFHKIYGCAGDKVEISNVSYRRGTGVLSFNARCESVTGVPAFVAQLRGSGAFADIRYEGYTEEIETHTVPVADTWGPLMDENGHHILNEDGSQKEGWIKHPAKVSYTKSYVFAVSALARAPEPHLPSPGESVDGKAGERESADDSADGSADDSAAESEGE